MAYARETVWHLARSDGDVALCGTRRRFGVIVLTAEEVKAKRASNRHAMCQRCANARHARERGAVPARPKTVDGVHPDDARNVLHRVRVLGWTSRQAGAFGGLSTRTVDRILALNPSKDPR